jgi:hypothetical protein
MSDIDQINERVCDGVLYYTRGNKLAVEDRRKQHEPSKMKYIGLANVESEDPFYVYECPICGTLKSF